MAGENGGGPGVEFSSVGLLEDPKTVNKLQEASKPINNVVRTIKSEHASLFDGARENRIVGNEPVVGFWEEADGNRVAVTRNNETKRITVIEEGEADSQRNEKIASRRKKIDFEEGEEEQFNKIFSEGKIRDLEVVANGHDAYGRRQVILKNSQTDEIVQLEERGQPSQELLNEITQEGLHKLAKEGEVNGQKIERVITNPDGKIELEIKNPDGSTNRIRQGKEGVVNLMYEIAPGKNWDQLRNYVMTRLRRAESINEFSTEKIAQFKNAINNYEFVGGDPAPEELQNLIYLMEIRGAFAAAEARFIPFDYKGANEILNTYLNDTKEQNRLKMLWQGDWEGNEVMPTGERVMQFLINKMESQENPADIATAGIYWREYRNFVALDPITHAPTIDPLTGQPKLDFAPGSVHKQIENELKAFYTAHFITLGLLPPVGGVAVAPGTTYEALNADQKKVVDSRYNEMRGLAERSLKVTGMASFYTGPIENLNAPNQRLMDLVIMDEIDHLPPGPLPLAPGGIPLPQESYPGMPPEDLPNRHMFPDSQYTRRLEYWEKWRTVRMNGPLDLPVNPLTGVPLSDPAGGVRRLMYFPEDLRRTAATSAKATSLWRSAETYFRPLPLWNGDKSLGTYLNKASNADGSFAATFFYADSLPGSGEIAGALTEIIIEPIKGGRHNADLDRINDNWSNIAELLKQINSPLSRGESPFLKYYATANIMGDVIGYINSDALDRLQHFPEWRKIRPEIINAILHSDVFNKLLDVHELERILRALGASDAKVESIHAAKGSGKLLGELLGVFGKGIGLGK